MYRVNILFFHDVQDRVCNTAEQGFNSCYWDLGIQSYVTDTIKSGGNFNHSACVFTYGSTYSGHSAQCSIYAYMENKAPMMTIDCDK